MRQGANHLTVELPSAARAFSLGDFHKDGTGRCSAAGLLGGLGDAAGLCNTLAPPVLTQSCPVLGLVLQDSGELGHRCIVAGSFGCRELPGEVAHSALFAA